MDAPPLRNPAPEGGWPEPTRGWRIDDAGLLTPRGRRTPWAAIDRFVQVEDGDGVSRVRAVLRDGRSFTVPGLSTTFAGLTRERAAQLDALNTIAAARRQPSVLVFPVVLRTSLLHRVASGVSAAALGVLAVAEVWVAATSAELRDAPLVGLFLLVTGGLLAWAAAWLLHHGWRSATITVNDVTVRSPFGRRRVPLAKVFAFSHHTAHGGARSCTALYWSDEAGRRSSRLALPGRDPDYRLPALDAYVKGLRPPTTPPWPVRG